MVCTACVTCLVWWARKISFVQKAKLSEARGLLVVHLLLNQDIHLFNNMVSGILDAGIWCMTSWLSWVGM